MNPIIFYSLLMLFAGIGIPIMATLNSRLAAQLGNPALATVILFAVGLESVDLSCTILQQSGWNLDKAENA